MRDRRAAGHGTAGSRRTRRPHCGASSALRESLVPSHEKGTRLGGSMLLSSCVIWRHREWSDFRRECPAGDPALQRLIWSGSTPRSSGSRRRARSRSRSRRAIRSRPASGSTRRAHAVAGGARRRRRARRAVDPGVGPTDPLHRWLRRLVRARVVATSVRPRPCGCARTPGRRATACTRRSRAAPR